MRRFLVFATLTLAACHAKPSAQKARSSAPQTSQIQTISSVSPQPARLDPPPMLADEAPPPKPKAMPWEIPAPIVFSPEDEKLRASLPFTPAIAMDPVDGSKISIRALTPTLEYKGKIYYFSSEASKRVFAANPEHALKGGFMKL